MSKLICILKLSPTFNYGHYIVKQVTVETNMSKIICDQFERYLIYYVLEHMRFNYCSDIINYLINNFIECATHKYSSFIIEQCVLKQGLLSEQLLDVNNVRELAVSSIGYHLLISVLQSNANSIRETQVNLKKIICKVKKSIRDTETGQKVIKEAQK